MLGEGRANPCAAALLDRPARPSFSTLPNREQLALYGGAPIREKPYPTWPAAGQLEDEKLAEVFAVTGMGWPQRSGHPVRNPLRRDA